MTSAALHRLVIVLGDQLDHRASIWDDFDPERDQIWMCECHEEATHVWSHQARIALFFAAMRQFAQAQREAGRSVRYHAIGTHPHHSLELALQADVQALRPQALCVVEPGEWRVAQALRDLAARNGCPLEVRPDRHFLCSSSDFAGWMSGRRQPRMEHFYRWMRQRSGWLMRPDGPVGGQWNFDAENRASFDTYGPPPGPAPRRFEPDPQVAKALNDVAHHFADHPGSLASFDWPVTRAQARQALEDFVQHRLPGFGRYQDAMWSDLAWPRTLLFHSRLSAALNLKLLDPREVCAAAIEAFESGHAPLAAVEGFVRQILGWREYVRGLYWHRMPGALQDNALHAHHPLPAFYWTGDTDMNCLRQALGETLAHGYAHHIQRLMITGLYALLYGVRPQAVHAWYLAIYVDAVEWVELPNTLGMSQFADGGVLASKPYIASGRYIQRMSNYCANCRYRPDQATGARACPVTTLYWDFLDRHEARFAAHPRLKFQIGNLRRKSVEERDALRQQAAVHRRRTELKVQS